MVICGKQRKTKHLSSLWRMEAFLQIPHGWLSSQWPRHLGRDSSSRRGSQGGSGHQWGSISLRTVPPRKQSCHSPFSPRSQTGERGEPSGPLLPGEGRRGALREGHPGQKLRHLISMLLSLSERWQVIKPVQMIFPSLLSFVYLYFSLNCAGERWLFIHRFIYHSSFFPVSFLRACPTHRTC